MGINEDLLSECAAGETENIVGLVVRGADPNHRHGPEGKTPLHVACLHGHQEVVAALLLRGGFPNFQDNMGRTALHFAASLGHLEIIKFLLEKESDPLIADSDGKTPLMLAKEAGFEAAQAALEEAQKKMEEKIEKERKQLEEEQRKIQQLRQMALEKEKKRMSQIPVSPEPPLRRNESQENVATSSHSSPDPKGKGKLQEVAEGEERSTPPEAAALPSPPPEASGADPSPTEKGLAGSRSGDQLNDPDKKVNFEDVYLDSKKKRGSGLLSRAKALSAIVSMGKETTKKSESKKRHSAPQDKGDKWINLLNQ